MLSVLPNLFIDSLQGYSVICEACVTLGTFRVTDPHPCTIVAKDVAAKESYGVDRVSWRTVELEVTEMVFAQLTCSRFFRQLVEIYEGGYGPTRLGHVGTLSKVCDVPVVMCVSVAEFGRRVEDVKD